MNNSRHVTREELIVRRSVELSRDPSAPSRTSGAEGLSGTQARAGVGVTVESGGFGESTTRPVEVDGEIISQHAFMLGADKLDDPSATLL